MTKQKIQQRFSSISWELDDLTIDEAIKSLQKTKEEYKKLYPKFTDFALSFESDPYDQSDGRNLYVVGVRDETDAECQARETKEKKEQQRREQYEREEYERMKKKFEKF